jgi:hypothetical protein
MWWPKKETGRGGFACNKQASKQAVSWILLMCKRSSMPLWVRFHYHKECLKEHCNKVVFCRLRSVWIPHTMYESIAVMYCIVEQFELYECCTFVINVQLTCMITNGYYIYSILCGLGQQLEQPFFFLHRPWVCHAVGTFYAIVGTFATVVVIMLWEFNVTSRPWYEKAIWALTVSTVMRNSDGKATADVTT